AGPIGDSVRVVEWRLIEGASRPEAARRRQTVADSMQAAAQLGDGVRVVSMPSTDVFDRQDAAYREAVLPKACRKRVAIEAGVSDFWRKYVGLDGAVVGIDSFGASAPIEALLPHFGFTVDRVVAAAQAL
ncbi:transketolase-like TK C-terminal-containing protein, partial [Thermomonas sp.]|uniref:transketolase-like TK C-terminal-containing protein n=1 Tax=Thermomonas sp. TaxID=1971895 RepID=UPI003782E6F8